MQKARGGLRKEESQGKKLGKKAGEKSYVR
jgi:hypothetical protein